MFPNLLRWNFAGCQKMGKRTSYVSVLSLEANKRVCRAQKSKQSILKGWKQRLKQTPPEELPIEASNSWTKVQANTSHRNFTTEKTLAVVLCIFCQERKSCCEREIKMKFGWVIWFLLFSVRGKERVAIRVESWCELQMWDYVSDTILFIENKFRTLLLYHFVYWK